MILMRKMLIMRQALLCLRNEDGEVNGFVSVNDADANDEAAA